jgi:hypothetical protein
MFIACHLKALLNGLLALLLMLWRVEVGYAIVGTNFKCLRNNEPAAVNSQTMFGKC